MFECEPRTLIWSKQPKRSYKRILSAQGTFSKRFSSAGFMFFSLSSFFTKQQTVEVGGVDNAAKA